MDCKFCNRTFKNKRSLDNHQNKAKYCLDIQKKLGRDITANIFKCKYCSKELHDRVRKTHMCKAFMKHEIDKRDQQIESLQRKLEALKIKSSMEKNFLEKRNAKCEMKNDKLRDKILLLKSNNSINNSTNNTKLNEELNALEPLIFDKKEFTRIIQEKFTKGYLIDGQHGVARFVVEHLLKDKNGNRNYICSDPSRHVYKYKDENGDIKRDVGAIKLINAIIDSIIRKSYDIALEQSKKNDEEGDDDDNSDVVAKFIGYSQTINDMRQDNSSFKVMLSAMLCM